MSVQFFAKLASAIFLALFSSGCATAPLWPEGGDAEPMLGYGATAQELADQCSGLSNLECARRRVKSQFVDYVDSRSHVEDYRKAANLTLFGLGGAAGVNAVTKGSKEGLQTLGLAAAGLVGLDNVLQADQQHKVFGAGQDALQCVMLTDRKLDGVQQSLLLAPPRTERNASTAGGPPAPYAEDDKAAVRGRTSDDAALAPYSALLKDRDAGDRAPNPTAATTQQTSEDVGPESASVLTAVANGRGKLQENLSITLSAAVPRIRATTSGQTSNGPALRTAAAQADFIFQAYEQQRDRLDDAETAIREAIAFRLRVARSADDDRADKLLAALNSIRKAVSDQLLYTHDDLKGIYAALKKAMTDAVKPPQTPPPSTTTPGGKTDTAQTIATLARVSGADDEIRTFAAAAEIAEKDLDTSEPYTKTYEDCLKAAAAKAEQPLSDDNKKKDGKGAEG